MLIVSNNIRHLAPTRLALIGLKVISPGKFIDTLFAIATDRALRALKKTLTDLESYSHAQLAAALELHGAKKTARHLRENWEHITFGNMIHDDSIPPDHAPAGHQGSP